MQDVESVNQLFAGRCWTLSREVKGDNGNKNEYRSKQSIEEELNRSVFTFRSTPDANEKIHRQQHEFEEQVKQQQIKRTKSTYDCAIKDKE